MSETRNRLALITGATSGIGAAFADAYAARGYDLIVTGRREQKIRARADGWTQAHGSRVEVVLAELAEDAAVQQLAARIRALPKLDVLVNNAGFGNQGRFHEKEPSSHANMVKVHVQAMVSLTHAALPGMLEQGRGAVVNVASVAAFVPRPGSAMYGATKACMSAFSEALHLELRGTGVRVQALCPGMTWTDFHERLGLDPNRFCKKRGLMRATTASAVVRASLQHLARDIPICIPGANWKLIVLLSRFLPRAFCYRLILRRART